MTSMPWQFIFMFILGQWIGVALFVAILLGLGELFEWRTKILLRRAIDCIQRAGPQGMTNDELTRRFGNSVVMRIPFPEIVRRDGPQPFNWRYIDANQLEDVS